VTPTELEEPGSLERSGSVTAELIERARRELGPDAVLAEPARLLPYESDACSPLRRRPALVLAPADSQAAETAVELLHEAGVPWTPRGAGTGLGGVALAPEGGAVLSVARLRRIPWIDASGRRARVTAGVINQALNDRLAPLGLCFAPDPASRAVATVGGNIAANAAGPCALRGAASADHTLGLQVILGDGTRFELGGAEETMAGYDLVGFFTGSRGTLGLITEAVVRLSPRPEKNTALVAVFASPAIAARAVPALLRADVDPAVIEIVTADAWEVCGAMLTRELPSGVTPAGGALLLVAIADGEASIETHGREIEALLAKAGAQRVDVIEDPSAQTRLWRARRRVFASLGRGARAVLAPDLVVPPSALAELTTAIAALAEREGVGIIGLFPSGDGGLHPVVFCEQEEQGQPPRLERVVDAMLTLALEAGGGLTGEQGVGLTRRAALRRVCTDYEIGLMSQLRRIFDPWDEVNPGKILPSVLPGEQSSLVASAEAREATDEPHAEESPGETPRPARRPNSAEREIAAIIRDAADSWTPLVPFGAGTLRVAPGQGTRLHLERLRQIVRYEPGDRCITVQAGVTPAEIDALLARADQRIAWEAPDPMRATIGGVVAAGYWSSRTQSFHHPKHSVLGLRAVTGAGEVISHGGRVLRNATAYDLGKLLVGSQGTLAVLTELTLRTFPRPRRQGALMVTGEGPRLLAIAASLSTDRRGWAVIDLLVSPEEEALLVGFEGRTKEEIDALRRAAELLIAQEDRTGADGRAPVVRRLEDEEARAAFRRAAHWMAPERAALQVRLVAAPGEMRRLAGRVMALCAGDGARAWEYRMQAHPGIGLLRVGFAAGYREPGLRRLLLALAEEVRKARGYRALERAPEPQWWGWDPWGTARDLRNRMRRIKLAFDPRNVFCPDFMDP